MFRSKSLDGLRGIAALNVAVCHFLFAFAPEVLHKNYVNFPENKDPGWFFELMIFPLFSIFYNGHYAVLIFFVISGYVLTRENFFLNCAEKDLVLKKRLFGRYFRLTFPIAAAVIISYVVYGFGLYYNINLPDVENYPIKNNFYNKNYNFFDALSEAFYKSIIYGQASFVPVLWTLRIEFIGSIYIILFYIIKPKSDNFLLLCLFGVILFLIHKSESIYFIAILLGSIIGFLKINKNFALIFFVFGIYFGGFQFKSFFYDFLPQKIFFGDDLVLVKTFYNLIGAFLVVAAVVNNFGRAFLEAKYVQFLGKISFSLYLTHFILLCSLSCGFYIYFPKTPEFIVLNFIIYIIDCFILSVLFYNYIDRESIGLSKKISNFVYK